AMDRDGGAAVAAAIFWRVTKYSRMPNLIDFILHSDRHLLEFVGNYGVWVYAILFLIIFAETGFVVTPFLPGDSLLFAIGALAAVDTSGTLTAPLASLALSAAAVLGNTTNYAIGRA